MSKRGSTKYTRGLVVGVAAVASLACAGPAAATPVATSDGEYQVLGRVFPDPLATCEHIGAEPCSPNAQGNVPATQFIQYQEFLEALGYMNGRPDWQRYMEVMVLDGKLGANQDGDEAVPDNALGVGSTPGDAMFPGNNLPLEFDPKPEYRSAGLPTPTLDRRHSDLITVRVTDETVPDAGKERYALSLSIHGIERAGLEGGTRAAEDLVTAFTTGKDDEPVVPESVDADAPSFADVLRETIIYFTYPNPDGWRRGSIADTEKGPGVFFQRYNGNGVDPNRDWPDIGFTFRPYSGMSEPETRALADTLTGIEQSTGAEFAAGDDLHGQLFADALSYTLLPHGRHDFAKNQRIQEAAIAIHRASEEALVWSPIVQSNDAPHGGGAPCSAEVPNGAVLGNACAQIYGQTWGTVYDTINYTTTGALGDWFDSSVGLGADGIDNEMSFSHLDKNIAFDPHTEQLHVDGNKALIYAHLAEMVSPREYGFDPAGTQGYVPGERITRAEQDLQGDVPGGTQAQQDISGQLGSPTADGGGSTEFPFTVERSETVYNGGMRVDITKGNVQGIGDGGLTALKVQCQGCDKHPGVHEDDEWITVSEDYNQSELYLQSGLTAIVNRPQPRRDGAPVQWRALVDGVQAAKMNVDFTSGPASTDGPTAGDEPPVLAGYDVANTDFLADLNPFIEDPAERFQEVDPRAVIDGTESLDGLDSLVLADDPLPGYTGIYEGEQATPSGQPSGDLAFNMTKTTVPGQGPDGCARTEATSERYQFTIEPDEANASMRVRIAWENGEFDYDLFLMSKDGADEEQIGDSQDFNILVGPQETIDVTRPEAGDYVVEVVNCSAAPASDVDPWSGTVDFEAFAAPPESRYTTEEKDAWIDALQAYAEGGGNLVLTDRALRALPELTEIPPTAVSRQTVYAGQMSFAEEADDDTTDEPLAENVRQPGARFNGGDEQKRRQTYEPTPLGYAIQSASGGDQSNARQFHVDKQAFTDAGGDVVATSADSGDRDAAADFENVTLGELPIGDGQIRIAGALLPQPTEDFEHTLGLEPYAVTYTGYIVFCNLIDCTTTSAPATEDTGTMTPGDGGSGGSDDSGGSTAPAPVGGDADPGVRPAPGPGPGPGKLSCKRGSKGKDRMRGTAGDDCLKGRGGNDRLRGGRGNDVLSGGAGNDVLNGGPGVDRLACGPGNDIARADSNDSVTGCEKVRRR